MDLRARPPHLRHGHRAGGRGDPRARLQPGLLQPFLAIAVFVGIAAFALGSDTVGATLVLVGAGSMLAASLVLLLSSPDKAAAAVKEGTLPARAVAALVVGLLV